MGAKLSPFVYKIKGKKNYLLVDLLRRRLFKITPEGDPYQLEKQLVEKKLAIETNGVIPLKFKLEVPHKKELIIRELQVRITGKCSLECNDCGEICGCFKGEQDMPGDILNMLGEQMKAVPLGLVMIVGGNPLTRMDLLKLLREQIQAGEYRVLLKNIAPARAEQQILKDLGITVAASLHGDFTISPESMSIDPYLFFYRHEFNPCWGNQIAVDVQGDIKACLWSDEILGNIKKNNIKDMVFSKKFDKSWELTKEQFEVCRDCEYRYVCPDCRVKTLKETGSIYSKTSYCTYDPGTGEWR
ncbi:MAG: SPASM domain-containing protein [Candidatus Aminicenantes bacterium]|nr:SPASM domain-containing protein [Candidatus Aminicenantes bacterium]